MVAGTTWCEGGSRRERTADALGRNELNVLLALTPENAAYLSGRASVIAALWRLPGLVAVAVNDTADLAVAAGDHEVGGYEDAVARFAHPLWIEHLDVRSSGRDLVSRVTAARPEGVPDRPAQFDTDLLLDAVSSAVKAVVAPGQRVGTELSFLPAWIAAGLRRRLPRIELVEAGAVFDDLRAIKDPDEIAHLRVAAELTEIGIAGARDALRPGLSAIGVSAAYQRAIWDRAAGDSRFAALRQVEGLVSVGDGSAPTEVELGETVKLDMQVDVSGYHSDVGRTYALEPTTEQQAVYDALRQALAASVAALGPGVPMRDVWSFGIEAMRAGGFPITAGATSVTASGWRTTTRSRPFSPRTRGARWRRGWSSASSSRTTCWGSAVFNWNGWRSSGSQEQRCWIGCRSRSILARRAKLESC